MIKKTLAACLLAIAALTPAQAADNDGEGLNYFLPKTAIRMAVLVEKTTFEPGQLARYADLYFHTQAGTVKDATYRIAGISFTAEGVPDSTKHYTLTVDKKHSLFSIDCTPSGVLKAINTQGSTPASPAPFRPAAKTALPNPHDYMSQDILSAGNEEKMAQMVAQEIFDIRDSRNQLSRGEADFMPQDGEQLRLMLAQLNTQEAALMQLFTGRTSVDTTETIVTFVPEPGVQKSVAFRFSKKLGMTDADDLAGTPYYIYVDDEHIIPTLPDAAQEGRKQKDDLVIGVNLPGKIKVRLSADSQTVAAFDTYAAQYGHTETLSGAIFGKKMTARLVLDTVTGNIVSLKVEPIE